MCHPVSMTNPTRNRWCGITTPPPARSGVDENFWRCLDLYVAGGERGHGAGVSVARLGICDVRLARLAGLNWAQHHLCCAMLGCHFCWYCPCISHVSNLQSCCLVACFPKREASWAVHMPAQQHIRQSGHEVPRQPPQLQWDSDSDSVLWDVYSFILIDSIRLFPHCSRQPRNS